MNSSEGMQVADKISQLFGLRPWGKTRKQAARKSDKHGYF